MCHSRQSGIGRAWAGLILLALLLGCLKTLFIGTLEPIGSCSLANPDASCPIPLGGCCMTTVDCLTGVCAADGGICIAKPVVTPACNGTGVPCDAGTCCGSCHPDTGRCYSLEACGSSGSGCTADWQCCADYYCDAGSCAPSCGAFGASCSTSADCCVARGFVCLPNGTCGFPPPTSVCSSSPLVPPNPMTSTTPCLAGACTLGAQCDGSSIDPCEAAGLVCRPVSGYSQIAYTGWSCQAPLLGQYCLQGGPPCQATPGSTQTPVCAAPGSAARAFCVQPCSDVATDCSAIDATCLQVTGFDSGICEPNPCFSPLSAGTCSFGQASNTVCLLSPGGSDWACQLAAVDGGGPGALCDPHATKQSGALCDAHDLCTAGGLCMPICNAGTRGVPSCGGEGDAGQPDGGQSDAGQCVLYGGSASDLDATGYCSIDCVFTDPDGGGCVSSPGGPPQKCLPVFSGANGICVAALAQPTAIGQPCDPTAAIDPCVAGAGCLGPLNPPSNDFLCVQFCRITGSVCPAGLTCQLAANANSSGYCFDGG